MAETDLMGYRRALSFGWARRDTLAVIVIALSVSFLVGATVLGVALGTQTTEIAAQFETPYTVASGDASSADGSGQVVRLTLSETTLNGDQVTVVGVPQNTPDITVQGRTIAFPPPSSGVLAAASYRGERSQTTVGEGDETVIVESRSSHPVLPNLWYITTPETAERFESPTVVTIRETDRRPSTPLVGALEFFVDGADELVRLLRLATIAAGVLVAVTIYSVVQMTIRERRPDIAVLRSTGASPSQILRLFALRALTLTTVGTAVGYGFGLILVRGVVNVAVYQGLPTTLSATVSDTAIDVLVPAVVFFLVVGALSGLLAGYRNTTRDPEALTSVGRTATTDMGRLSQLTEMRVVEWDALVPTTATLTVFMCALLLLTAVAGAVGPLADTNGQTITEPDAPNPIASDVPLAYVDILRSQGATASPEILLFEVYEGQPIVARGVNFTAYSQLSSVDMVRGSPPRTEFEAVIGQDLAQSTGLSPGETIVVGGSTEASVMRLELTGTFAGTGIQDDQLLVSLDAAQEMAHSDDSVDFIRVDNVDTDTSGTSTIVITDARAVRKENRTGVSVHATNLGLSETSRDIEVRFGERVRQTTVTLDSRRSTRAFVPFEDLSPGTYRLIAGDVQKNVTITQAGPSAIEFGGSSLSIEAPQTAPLNSTPRIRVVRGDQPVANATVRVGDGAVQTNSGGYARVRLASDGNVTVVAETGTRQTSTNIRVSTDAPRVPVANAVVSPDSPSIFTRPQATISVWNPWQQPVNTTLTVTSPELRREQTLSLNPGERMQTSHRLPRLPAGTYTVAASTASGAQTTATYTVRGDARLGAALAQSGRYSGGGGITQAIQVAFGNIEVLVIAILSLLAVMTVGSTTAAFMRSVHTTRREIGIRRATGADPWSVLSDVFLDTLKVGGTATMVAMSLAFVVVQALLAVGELRVFGLVLNPVVTPQLVAGAFVCGLVLSVVSATLATVAVIRRDPSSLLRDRHIPIPSGNDK